MADQLKSTQTEVQVEYTSNDRLKSTQTEVQVEYTQFIQKKLSQLVTQVAYQRKGLTATQLVTQVAYQRKGLTATQLVVQFAYEPSTSYTGTPSAVWVKVVGVPPSAVLTGQVLVISTPSWAVTKAINPVVNKPAQSRLMRHGKYYFANVEKPYYWAGHDV
jgi:hypothetical protein